MSAELEYLRTVIQNRWTESVGVRTNDVPYPGDDRIYLDTEERKIRHRAQSDLLVLEKGTRNNEPQGFGHTSRGETTTVTIKCKSSDSRARVVGKRTGSNECDDYGGLSGEVQRILDEVRTGHKEFSTIQSTETFANHSLEESGVYREDVEVELDIIARVINP